MGQILSVNVGHAVDAAWAGRIKRTAIDKHPVPGRAQRTGAYFRVIEEGEVAAGDPAVVTLRPEDGVTVTESFRAYLGDRDLMRRLLQVPGLGEKWQPIADHVLRGTG